MKKKDDREKFILVQFNCLRMAVGSTTHSARTNVSNINNNKPRNNVSYSNDLIVWVKELLFIAD